MEREKEKGDGQDVAVGDRESDSQKDAWPFKSKSRQVWGVI
jgi:hypothetical protein